MKINLYCTHINTYIDCLKYKIYYLLIIEFLKAFFIIYCFFNIFVWTPLFVYNV